MENTENKEQIQGQGQQMPKDVEVGYHKGSLNTLASERAELWKMIQNVEAIMSLHIKRLEELGVKVQVKKE